MCLSIGFLFEHKKPDREVTDEEIIDQQPAPRALPNMTERKDRVHVPSNETGDERGSVAVRGEVSGQP